MHEDTRPSQELPHDPSRGPAGPRGQAGAGVSRGTRRFAIALITLAVVLGGANLLSSYLQNRQFEQSQKTQAQLGKASLCKTLLPLEALAHLKPPPGNPQDNPSRAYEQQLSAKLAPLAQLGPDIGCRP